MSNLLKRSITGLFFVAILIGSIVFSSISFFFLFLIITIAGMLEFYKLSRLAKAAPQKYVGLVIGILFFIFNFFYSINYIDLKFFLIFIPLLVLVFVNELYLNNKRPFTNIAYTLLGVIYVAVPFSMMNYFVFRPGIEMQDLVTVKTALNIDFLNNMINYFSFLKPNYNFTYTPNRLLGFFFLLWANDTGAYIFGVSFGKHRLFERVSPKKSWEGSLGGAAVTMTVAYFLSKYFVDITFVDWMIIGLIIVIMGTWGDLVESLFKRSINIKDSGNILPGHGGMLDRFDSVLLAAPIVFTYLQLSC